MRDIPTTISLAVLTAISLAACIQAVARLLGAATDKSRRLQYALVGLCVLGSTGVFMYRLLVVHQRWQPLQSHVDGLLLIASLFGVMVLFLQSRGGVAGLVTFALPVLTLILAWSVCASAWTFHPFEIDSVWMVVHLACVFLGALFFCVAAVAGGMFLYAQWRLRHKAETLGAPRLASLEAIERLMVWASALGFSLLTLGLVTGLVIVTSGPTRLGPGWWYSPKIILAVVVWLIYALVMNTRHATRFRGVRAAWLSIAGFVLLWVVFGIVNALPGSQENDQPGRGGGRVGVHQEGVP